MGLREVRWHPKRGFTEDGVSVRECAKCPHILLHAAWDPVKHRRRHNDLRFKTHNANRCIVLRQVYSEPKQWRSIG